MATGKIIFIIIRSCRMEIKGSGDLKMIYRYGYRRIIGSVNVDLKIWLREKLFYIIIFMKWKS